PDILSTIPAWVYGNAAKVLRVSGRVSGAERDVIGGRVDTGRWIFDTDDLFHLVDEVRAACIFESVGRVWTRMENKLAASNFELRKDPSRDLGSLRVHTAR